MFKKLWHQFFDFKPANRSDYVVYLMLVVFLFISFAADIGMSITKIALGERYDGASPYLALILTLLVLAGTLLFRRGYTKLINELFLLFLLFVYSDIVYNSKPENEFAILLMVIYVIVAAITLKGKSFIISIVVLFSGLFVLSYLKIHQFIPPNRETNFSNVAGIAIILLMIVFISWLFNFEINSYISQLEASKKLLQKERDLLETKVEARTKELQAQQAEKMAEFSKFAEFGRLAQGLFHDLINPLTALSLNLNLIKKGDKKNISELNDYIEGATAAANNMEKLINSTRNYFQHRVEKTSFSLIDELVSLQQIMHYKAERAGVELIFQDKNDIKVYGNKARFSQLMGNLVLNAIEAYSERRKNNYTSEKKVIVSFLSKEHEVTVSIKDFACGLPPEIKEKIFSALLLHQRK